MKITFKDGQVVENIKNITITNVKKNGVSSPIINIVFDSSVGFSDLENIITENNVDNLIIATDDDNVTRTLTGFNKVYMAENISDISYSFIVSIEKED